MIVIPAFLSRTIAGIPEKESVAFFFMFLSFYLFLKAWKTEKLKFAIILGTLAGISDRGLSEQLARLAPKQEALIMGWGVPIPVTVKVRDFFELEKELKGKSIKSTQTAEESIKELGFV